MAILVLFTKSYKPSERKGNEIVKRFLAERSSAQAPRSRSVRIMGIKIPFGLILRLRMKCCPSAALDEHSLRSGRKYK
jgi:hypothetical protein